MEEKSDGKRKTSPSIPANYVSIRHLQERWINEKDRKRKEEEEKRWKQQVEEQPRIDDDLKKTEKARGQRDEEKRLDRSNRKNFGRNRTKKEDTNGEDAKFAEKEEPEVTVAIGSERGEDTAAPEKKLRGFRRKRYKSKKKKNQDVAVVEDVVVDCSCESIAPLPEVVVTEKITPVKDMIRDYRKKGKKATGKKSVEYREKTVTEVTTTAIETQFEDLSIKKLQTKNLKAKTRSSNRNRLNQGNDLVHKRVRMPPIRAPASTMVWVKKEQNEKAGDGIASGVKRLNA